jgi:D-alanine-D-alanine ligase-like ATP-grasp enzyme
VWDGNIIDIQEKKRKKETPDDQVNWQIRNHDNGFIFARSEVAPPRCILDYSLAAVSALGLDFGAVDLGYNVKREEAVVYEVNTAPGLEGSTLDAYFEAAVQTFPDLKLGAYKRRRINRGF